MTAAANPTARAFTIEEYLEQETHALVKHQYRKGQIEPMPGGTLKHNTIASNALTYLHIAIRQNKLPYLVSNSDTKIWIPAVQTFYYPDAVVICERVEFFNDRKDVILNPLLIVEVSSPSTETKDQGDKFRDYATLPSFREYLLLSQDAPAAQVSYRPTADAPWEMHTVEGLQQLIDLRSIGCTLDLEAVYFKTEGL